MVNVREDGQHLLQGLRQSPVVHEGEPNDMVSDDNNDPSLLHAVQQSLNSHQQQYKLVSHAQIIRDNKRHLRNGAGQQLQKQMEQQKSRSKTSL